MNGCNNDKINDKYLELIPLFKYQKKPVVYIDDLYLKYPQGGEAGWYALVLSEGNFAYWNMEEGKWRFIGIGGAFQNFYSGTQMLTSVSAIVPMGTTTVSISASETLSLIHPERLKPGYVMSIRVRNTSDTLIFVTLPDSGEYEVDKWYQAAVYPGMVTEFIIRCFAPGKYAVTYIINKKSEIVPSPGSATYDAGRNVLS
ncbi:hypothetical protein IR083_19820 [Dysgonomonas sp. GY75]|uniref:hypothetical protein n=1 Tax=Dysgonomonas sp. GY75 TaxID=2780419 RepID=UPI001883D0C7|nr:hypothetical protein [Dysgonomonas sp. GY75]MBF0651068.1 hypothetical protein [Dysgonomonas sp. GY75]